MLLGVLIRASRSAVVCKSVKMALQAPGPAPKDARKRAKLVEPHVRRWRAEPGRGNVQHHGYSYEQVKN